eukprot:127257-Prymnesium_polylepis.1
MDEEARTYKNSLTSTPGMVAIVVNAARKSFAGGALARRRSSATVEDRLSQQLGSGAAPPPPTCLPPPSGRANGSGGYRLLTEDKNGPMAVHAASTRMACAGRHRRVNKGAATGGRRVASGGSPAGVVVVRSIHSWEFDGLGV